MGWGKQNLNKQADIRFGTIMFGGKWIYKGIYKGNTMHFIPFVPMQKPFLFLLWK